MHDCNTCIINYRLIDLIHCGDQTVLWLGPVIVLILELFYLLFYRTQSISR